MFQEKKKERLNGASASIDSCRFFFIAGAGIEPFMTKVRIGKESFCK